MSETSTEVLQTHRDEIRKRSAPWLRIGLAQKILYAIGLHCDGWADALAAGVKLRFPGYYDNQSLPLLGRERRIPRGRNESHASYAQRLARFLTDHRRRGGPYAMLTQLYHYFHPVNFTIDLVYYSGRRFTLVQELLMLGAPVDEAITRDDVVWTPDSNAAKWARWWLIYYTDQWASTPPTAAEETELRLIPRQWNAAHALGTIVLFPSTAELWNWPPGRTWNESGTWNTSGTVRYLEVEP